MRILADTSVWIDHFRTGNDQFASYLQQNFIVVHRYIIGELALGSIKDRETVFASLDRLTQIEVAQTPEVRTRLWTLDRKLKSAAGDLDLSFGEVA